MSFSLSRFKGSSCSGWISGGPLELPWCQIKYEGPIPWYLMSFSGEKSPQKSSYKAKHWNSWSQEHTRPPRIQEENFGFNSRFPKSGYDLTLWKLWNHYLTSRKPRGRPQTWLLNPFLEGKMSKKVGSRTGWFHRSDWAEIFLWHPGYHKSLTWKFQDCTATFDSML